MKSKPGTYILVLESNSRKRVQIGKWGQLEIVPGYYLYVGSAFGPGGVLSRVSRHCCEEKSKRWHVDFLRESTSLDVVWYIHGSERLEHQWAKALEGAAETASIKGFGCSDCQCMSHLFFVTQETDLGGCARMLPGRLQYWHCYAGG